MKDRNIIGVDIGGTKIAAGVVGRDGSVKASITLPTKAESGYESSLGQVYLAVENLLDEASLQNTAPEAIGVCAPGPLAPEKGIVYNPPNLPGWDKVPLTELLIKRYNCPVKLENDANAAGLAETLWGAGRGHNNVFYVTVSTGIGTAIIIGGKVYHGKNGMAAEGGHVTLKYDGEVSCNCGVPGCVESLASGRATEKYFKWRVDASNELYSELSELFGGSLGAFTMKDIAKAAKAGITVAQETFERQGRFLGLWLGSMISVLDPDVIIIGGGVSLAGELLLEPVRAAIPGGTINMFASATPVLQAELRNNVGICGAAAAFITEEE